MRPKPNQVVVALTPVVFAPLAGAISVWAAKTAGVHIDESSLQAIFIAGATIALAKAALWLRGWQEYEKHIVIAGANPKVARAQPQPAPADGGDQTAAQDGEVDLEDADDLDDFLDDDTTDDDEPVPAGAAG